MSTTNFGVNHPLAVKLWSKRLYNEAYRQTFIGKFIGKEEDSLIQEKTDLRKQAGDQITCGLNLQLDGDGVEGDATLEGNEEALQFFDDKLLINQLRHATRSKGKMSEQRVPYNVREIGKGKLGNWWARRMDTAFFNHICGNTSVTDTRYTGHNATIAPSTNRHIWQGGVSNDQSITSSHVFTLDLVTIARQRAETASTEDGTGPLIRPLRINGEDMYVMFLHDYQEHSLRTNTSTGQWLDIQKAALQGGDIKKNPIFTNALGVYNGVVLHKASRVTTGVNSSSGAAVSTVRRAVLCGAQAATIAFGSENGATRYSWYEQLFDYGNQLGVSAGCIWGLKKNKFIPADDSSTNAEDFGTVVVSTYGAAATTS
jgi:N4-gp56 family major capsid protein